MRKRLLALALGAAVVAGLALAVVVIARGRDAEASTTRVPDVTGLTWSEAARRATRAGLCWEIWPSVTTGPPNHVVRQAPRPGRTAARHAPLLLFLGGPRGQTGSATFTLSADDESGHERDPACEWPAEGISPLGPP